MGTSQSHNIKSGPNWSNAKRAMTKVIKSSNDQDAKTANYNFMHSFGKALSGSVYSVGGSGGTNSSHGFGRSGARVAKSFSNFLAATQNSGFSFLLDGQSLSQIERKDLLHCILDYIIGEDDANTDDDAAKVAMDIVLNEIFAECDSNESVEEVIKSATQVDKDRWIIDFFVNYIVEYSTELFQKHIFGKGGDAVETCNKIKNYLNIELQERFMERLRDLDLNSSDGQLFLDNMTKEILEIWQ